MISETDSSAYVFLTGKKDTYIYYEFHACFSFTSKLQVRVRTVRSR